MSIDSQEYWTFNPGVARSNRVRPVIIMIKNWTKARQEQIRKTISSSNIKEMGRVANELAVEMKRLKEKSAEYNKRNNVTVDQMYAKIGMFGPRVINRFIRDVITKKIDDTDAHLIIAGLSTGHIRGYLDSKRKIASYKNKIQKRREALKTVLEAINKAEQKH